MPMDKTFDAATAEGEISARWEEAGAFRAGANAREGAEPFCILLPPPNVTGSLHMGHAFNHTLMDILTRWHRMRGFDTLWQPGLDHAGIATQMVVERELAREGNAGRRELGREAFVERVWEWKERSGGTILEQSRRLGDSFDLSRNRFTMDPQFQEAVLKVFVDWYHNGLIFRGKRMVNWDPHFETAISDLEVENVEVDGQFWHFKYPLENGETYEYVEKDEGGTVTLRETRDYIAIATTRPETMLGDGAVAVHPSDARYAPIVGKLCEIPVGPKAHRRLIPIITDEYPDPAFGSGAVKITGAHDFNDYAVAERHRIPKYRLMDMRGGMRSDGQPYAEAAATAKNIVEARQIRRGLQPLPTGFFIDTGDDDDNQIDQVNLVPEDYRGLDRFECRKRVVADIEAEGLMLGVEAKKIMQPFGDRSKVVVEPMLTDQWFVDAEKLVGPAMEAVRAGRTRVLPESQEKIYFHWLENIQPWCISRQLWWGHRIPVWYGPELMAEPGDLGGYDLGEFHTQPFCAESFQQAAKQALAFYETAGLRFDGVVNLDSFDDLSEQPSNSLQLVRDPDVLDTWFSSGIWPIGTMGWPEETPEMRRYFPSSVLVTGFDILFFWVARMMMMQLEITGEVPFRDVYIHPLVRDEKGKKMSKSLGNALDPIELIDRYGADAVRFTLASMAAMGRDLRLSEDRIAGYRNFGTKLWNAARFAEMNDCRPDPAFDTRAVRLTANRWIVGETGRLRETLDASLAAYRFNDAASALYAHVWGRVCDWYVELAKPLLQDAAAAAETRATMAWVLDQCLILMHPFMPFVTEALWGQITDRATLLAHAEWPGYGAELVEPRADAEMSWVIALIETIRSVRAGTHVPAGARVPLIELELAAPQAGALARNRALVARLARVARFETAAAAPRGAVTIALEGGTFCLPLADVIDIGTERARLAKALDKLGRETGGLRAKLANPGFLAKAPEAVVGESRARLETAEEETAILRAAEARLAALD